MGNRKRNDDTDKNPISVSGYTDEHGNLCIGGDCVRITIPKDNSNNIQIDISECSEEVKDEIAKKLVRGVPTEYTIRKKDNG